MPELSSTYNVSVESNLLKNANVVASPRHRAASRLGTGVGIAVGSDENDVALLGFCQAALHLLEVFGALRISRSANRSVTNLKMNITQWKKYVKLFMSATIQKDIQDEIPSKLRVL